MAPHFTGHKRAKQITVCLICFYDATIFKRVKIATLTNDSQSFRFDVTRKLVVHVVNM